MGLVDFLVEREEFDAKAGGTTASIASRPSYRALLSATELVDELRSDTIRAAMRRQLVDDMALLQSEEF